MAVAGLSCAPPSGGMNETPPRTSTAASSRPRPSTTPTAQNAPSAPPPAPPDAPLPANDLSLVASCFTAAVEALGWLPAGAHQGQFMKTALDAGGPASDCRRLVADDNKFDYAANGGRRIGWQPIERAQRGEVATVQLRFTCTPECGSLDAQVVLPVRWHCFSWVHQADHSSECHPTEAACKAAKREKEQGARMTTPCSLEPHAAWCIDAPHGRCLPGPWDCDRELATFRSAFGPTARCIKRP